MLGSRNTSDSIAPAAVPSHHEPLIARSTQPRTRAGISSSIARVDRRVLAADACAGEEAEEEEAPRVPREAGEHRRRQVERERDHEQPLAAPAVGQVAEDERARRPRRRRRTRRSGPTWNDEKCERRLSAASARSSRRSSPRARRGSRRSRARRRRASATATTAAGRAASGRWSRSFLRSCSSRCPPRVGVGCRRIAGINARTAHPDSVGTGTPQSATARRRAGMARRRCLADAE